MDKGRGRVFQPMKICWEVRIHNILKRTWKKYKETKNEKYMNKKPRKT